MALLIFAWLAYFILHSVLASRWVKDKVHEHIPVLFKYYRIVYNVIAMIGLSILLYFSLSPTDLFHIPYHQLIGYILSLVGLYFMRKAFQSFSMAEFLGLKPEGDAALVTTGMYAYVRHPLYFANIWLIGGLFLLFPSLSMLLILLVSYLYILIGSKLEERKLRNHFGQAYADYAKKVKALIPYVY